mgnify:FL=1
MMKEHTIPPFYNSDSKVLILGSFPSVKSREEGFYYAHPQNRFWKVLASIFNEEITDKKAFLKKHQIALFDVCASCEIKGSSDASIKKVIPNDIKKLIKESEIKVILLNGKTATNLFEKWMKDIEIPTISLPSTSPANATYSLDKLTKEYEIIKKFTK